MPNPCVACGACCAHYRVSFYWTEAEPFLGGTVPSALTAKLDPHRLVMAGTQARPARCVALEGVVGRGTACRIYPDRPSPCRDLQPSWAEGAPNDQCDRARLAHGLPPLTADDFVDPVEPTNPPRRRAS